MENQIDIYYKKCSEIKLREKEHKCKSKLKLGSSNKEISTITEMLNESKNSDFSHK
jgi:hypothetical protein